MHFYCHFENKELTPWTHITLIKLNKESPVVKLGSGVPEKRLYKKTQTWSEKGMGGNLFGAANLTQFQNLGQA